LVKFIEIITLVSLESQKDIINKNYILKKLVLKCGYGSCFWIIFIFVKYNCFFEFSV